MVVDNVYSVDINCYISLKITLTGKTEFCYKVYRRGEVIRAAVVFISVGFIAFVNGGFKIWRGIKQNLAVLSLVAPAVNMEIGVIPKVGVIGNLDINFYLIGAVGCAQTFKNVYLVLFVLVNLIIVGIAVEVKRRRRAVTLTVACCYVTVCAVSGDLKPISEPLDSSPVT